MEAKMQLLFLLIFISVNSSFSTPIEESFRILQERVQVLEEKDAIKTSIIENLKEQIQSQKRQIEANAISIQSLSKPNSTLLHSEENLTASQKIPKNCNEVKEAGHTKENFYTIDPDGENVGENPFEVYCHSPEQGPT